MNIRNVTVIGAGTMGNGIAHVFAQYGFNVILNDVKEEFVERGLNTIKSNLERQVKKGTLTGQQKSETLSRLKTTTDLPEACRESDIVIEAVTENEGVKKELFRAMDKLVKPDALLASNTSSISITTLGTVTKRPGKVI
ncbi:MAG TPA: 3-hydroxyacyl-CoA dehydrogenase NAD-binding domain-containing protein, partial [Bacteroidota bacterium]|nr:3-hydroxyacyl-CoA dehydrogenase NAD-binding domain-containing protein [Bacteroidota bacterium]